MSRQKTITVLGAGYVGLTTATLLAHAGYKVYIVEPARERLRVIKKGKSFFYEHGLEPLIKLAIDADTLLPTDSYDTSVPKSSLVLSCVGTPDNPDGSSNLSYVFAAAQEAARFAKPGTIYVQKSTVPVGTGQQIEALFRQAKVKIDYISSPEFLREGTGVKDTLFFDRIVVGGQNPQAIDQVMKLYMDLEKYREHIAHLAKVPLSCDSGRYIATSLNSAELIKVTANAFLALKISFANSIAQLADKTNADIVEVMDAVGADKRIGRAFLSAGRGYGGGCFPKDVSGLISSALEHGVDLEIMHAAQSVNASMPDYIVGKLHDEIGSLKGKKIAVLGLAFKAGTSDVRKSPGVAIANKLTKAGAIVTTYDPQAHEEAAPDLAGGITQRATITEAIEDVSAAIITTDWPEIIDYPAKDFAKNLAKKVLFDAVNHYDAVAAQNAGLRYIGVGHKV